MRKNVLVIEDDSGIASLVKEALNGAGFEVAVERDGDAALVALERRLPNLVITDLVLPTIPGFEVLERLRVLPGGRDVPTIVMSGIYKSTRHKKLARDTHGAAAFFEKPFDINALVHAAMVAVGLAPAEAKKAPPATSTGRKQRASAHPDDGQVLLAEPDAARATTSAPGGLRGNLRQTHFPELLTTLYRAKATGGLLLRRGRIKKIVTLKDGYPTFAKSNLVSECLGRILVREKLIREEECERSVQLLPTSNGKLQGALLVDMGALTAQNLGYGLQLQLEHKLFDVFSWPEGDFQFDPRAEAPSLEVALDVPLPMLIYEGVRRKVSDDVVADRIEPFLDSYLGPHPEPVHRAVDLALEADDGWLVAMADGTRTLREVVTQPGLSPSSARQLVYALIAGEVLVAGPRPAKTPARSRIHGQAPPLRGSPQPPPLPSRRGSVSPRPGPPARSSGTERAQRDAIESGNALDLETLRTKLSERARRQKRLNHFEVLGISPRAGLMEVQRAYANERETLPQTAELPGDLSALVEQIGRQLTTAYDTLSDERRRTDYLARHAAGFRSTAFDELHKLLSADDWSRRGEQALEDERFADAASHFREALSLSPSEGELQALYAWSQYRRTPDDPVAQVEAIQRLQRALDLAPHFDRGWLWLGRVVHRAGRPGEATKHFERALACNPDNREAHIELKHA